MTLVSTYPNWLYDGLNLQEAKIPKELDASIIQSTIDVYQNGWALADYQFVAYNLGVEFGIDAVLIPTERFPPAARTPNNRVVSKKVICIDMRPVMAGNSTVFFELVRLTDNARTAYRFIDVGAATGRLDWLQDINAGSVREWIVPPGWQLNANISASGGAGDTLGINVLWTQMPAGFHIGV